MQHIEKVAEKSLYSVQPFTAGFHNLGRVGQA